MEPILLILESWWWVAPAAAGAGAATYAGLTTQRRRARRLELDAARHEETAAYRALVAAKAGVSDAQAKVLAARAGSGRVTLGASLIESALDATGLAGPVGGDPATAGARRRLQEAKLAERSASLALRASRARLKAAMAQYHATSKADPLPIEKVFAAHDAVIARWMAYETDVEKALAYPQLTDASRPATLAFLRAQREAQRLRPASARDRIPPQQFVEYRAAVQALADAFDEAERAAGAAPRPAAPRPGLWPLPDWLLPRSTDPR